MRKLCRRDYLPRDQTSDARDASAQAHHNLPLEKSVSTGLFPCPPFKKKKPNKPTQNLFFFKTVFF